MRKFLVFLALMLSLGLWGCGGGGGSAVCDVLVGCGVMTRDECQQAFSAYILPGGCEEAITEASCDEHAKETPSYMDLCFPLCAVESATCAGDIITSCYEGRTFISRCGEVCKLVDMSYSGVCDDEYMGQTSDTGFDVCWCR